MKHSQVKMNAVVACPADRGDPAYKGTVTHIGSEVSRTVNDVEYVWVEVRHPGGTKHVWPSNRLG